MPTKRTRRKRVRRVTELTPAERQWLTGERVEGADNLWRFRHYEGKVERCRLLIAQHPELVPPGHMAELEEDIRRWSPPVPRGLASFR